MTDIKKVISMLKQVGVKVTRKRSGFTVLRFPNPTMFNEVVIGMEKQGLDKFQSDRSELTIKFNG